MIAALATVGLGVWVGVPLGVVLIGGSFAWEWARARSPRKASWLENELTVGHRLREKARNAHPATDDLFQACQAFITWGNRIQDWVAENVPACRSELEKRAPISITGKSKALADMDAVLVAVSDVAKKLETR